MDNIINDFFSRYEDNYYSNIVNESGRVFSLFDLDISDEVSNIILNQNNSTDQDIVDTILETINEISIQVLNEHGLFINTDIIIISDLLKIVESIYLMQNYINGQDLLDILELENIDNNEKIANILNLFCYISVENLILYIDKVDDSLLVSIKNLYLDEQQISAIIDELFTTIVSKYKKIKELNNNEIFGDRFILNNNSIGLDFDVYFDSYKNYFISVDILSNEQIAYDLISICALSNKCLSILLTLNEYTYKLKPEDGLFAIKVTTEIKKLLSEMKI